MALIKLEPQELVAQAKIYTQKSEDIDNILKELTTMQNSISDNWEGEAWQKFDEQFEDLSKKVNDFSQLLRDINQQLNEVARVIADTDAEIASKLGFK